MQIRQERPGDAAAIRFVTEAAFKDVPHSDETEAKIVDALREAGALYLSLVATEDTQIIGHVAFSPIHINAAPGAWYGLGPVSVRPDRQRGGVGQQLVQEGLKQLKVLNASGCVVFGDPSYYGRFGFECDPALFYADAPPGYFQRLAFDGNAPIGEVTYHAGFNAT
jgi:putative acetyltransferase